VAIPHFAKYLGELLVNNLNKFDLEEKWILSITDYGNNFHKHRVFDFYEQNAYGVRDRFLDDFLSYEINFVSIIENQKVAYNGCKSARPRRRRLHFKNRFQRGRLN
jgi:hypothetical protein